jgi:hypothetical protein
MFILALSSSRDSAFKLPNDSLPDPEVADLHLIPLVSRRSTTPGWANQQATQIRSLVSVRLWPASSVRRCRPGDGLAAGSGPQWLTLAQ